MTQWVEEVLMKSVN